MRARPDAEQCKTTRESSRDASLAKLSQVARASLDASQGRHDGLIHGSGIGRGRLVLVSKQTFASESRELQLQES